MEVIIGKHAEQELVLKPQNEFRFEVGEDSPVSVTLLEGNAEIFGAELAIDRTYTLSGVNSCVFTWFGCKIKIVGNLKVGYISEESLMNIYLNVHSVLQEKREFARNDPANNSGPVVLIVGPTDSGKSTLSHILVNYAARLGEHVTYVDLDVGQNDISIPGVISAISVDKPMDIELKWSRHAPLSYFYGYISPENDKLYKVQMENLNKALAQKDAIDEKSRVSGRIINTCGWIDGLGYRILLDTIATFTPTVILVLGHDRLYNDLKKDLQDKDIIVSKIPKSGGVVTRDTTFRRKARNSKIKEYFYGKDGSLRPHLKSVNIASFTFLKIGAPQVPLSALPIGHELTQDTSLKVTKVVPSPSDIMHSVLAISFSEDEDDIINTNVAGFIYVEKIDEKKKLSCLTPTLTKIPSKLLILGGLKWLD